MNSMCSRPIVICLLTAIFLTPCQADITLDGSFGPANSAVPRGPDNEFEIREDMGRTVGSNLFHSFGKFSVGMGETANFVGTSPIENIFGRVTGGVVSTIDGTLRTDFAKSSPNLYLVNPAGVLFGPNASLEVQGSFHVSSADFVRFEDGAHFNSMRSAEDQLLTTAPPEAFGFLGEKAGPITLRDTSLEVQETETVSIVGGEIRIAEDSFGSFIDAPSGSINLVSVSSEGIVPIFNTDFDWQAFDSLGRIEIMNSGGADNIDASAGDLDEGGTVFILGGQITMIGSRIKADGDRGGTVRVRGENVSIEGEGINIESFESRNGSINIDLSGDLSIQGGELRGIANPIDIKVNKLAISDAGLIFSDGEGSKGGDINIVARESVSVSGIGFIGMAEPFFSRISSTTTGDGDAGNISIATKILEMDDGGLIDVGASNAFADSTGNAGTIDLNVERLHLTRGSQIRTETFTKGSAGTLSIRARDIVAIAGFGEGFGFEDELSFSGLFSDTSGLAPGGDIFLTAPRVLINEGIISSESTGMGLATQEGPSTGKSGNISITAIDSLLIQNGGKVTVETVAANAGRIDLKVGSLLRLSNQAAITTSAANGQGNGGNIDIDPEFVILDDSEIRATAAEGSGGNIRIVSDFVFALPGSIDASSEAGIDGTVDIDSPDTNISGSIAVLPETYINAGDQLSERCGARSANLNSFTVKGRGGVPLTPNDASPASSWDKAVEKRSFNDPSHIKQDASLVKSTTSASVFEKDPNSQA